MRQLNYENKMALLDTDTKVKFNVSMHGKNAGDVVKFSSSPNDLKINIRRRLADNDNSVEVLQKNTKLKEETKKDKKKDGGK